VVNTVSGSVCDNCGVNHGPDDIFCENCGYDFITGSLPRGDEEFPVAPQASPVAVPAGQPASGGVTPPLPGKPPLPARKPEPPASTVQRMTFEITADRPYFDSVVAEGELDFPDPPPVVQELEVAATEVHIGRTSESRAIHPDLDIANLTGDPAVSSRHAVIRVASDGRLTITDIGSTNGTFVGGVDTDPITVGEAVALEPGTPVYVGAWTRLALSRPGQGSS
jgi:hypothetical protein